MALISQRIENILNGVSQQPQEKRRSSQAQEQVNAWSHITRGLLKRPGSQHVAKLTSDIAGFDRAHLHVIDFNTKERYYLILTDGGLYLFDAFTGAPQGVAFPDGMDYFLLPPKEILAEFTQPNAGSGLYWDGSNYVVPSGLETYHFGDGPYKFLRSSFNTGTTPADQEVWALILDNQVLQGGAPDGLGHSPYFGNFTCTYPVPEADCGVEAKVLFKESGGAGGNDEFRLNLRQQGTDPDSGGSRYTFAIIPQTTTTAHAKIGATVDGGANGYSDIGAATSTFAWNTNTTYTVKFTATTDAGGNVQLKGYIDGVEVIARTDPNSNPGRLLTAGFAGFYIEGHDENATVQGGGTYLDDFKITSGRVIGDALPFGTGPLYRAVTIGQQTVIANTLKTVQSKTTTLPTRAPEALIYVRQADYSTTYTVNCNGITKSHTTGNGSSPASRASITTDTIADALRAALAADATLTSQNFTFTRTGSTIYVTRTTGLDFTLTATDGLADDAILAIKGKVQRFEDLPLRCTNGVILEVSGDPGSEFDNYFVQYSDSGAPAQAGVWTEVAKPGEKYQLDPLTMPWVLTKTANGEWQCGPGTWKDRACGSLVTNPFPSFVGFPIKELFYHEGRLGFTSGANIILSETGQLFNFTRKTVKALYDSDYIDVKGAFQKSQTWHSAIHWNERLLLWSDNAQVFLEGDPALTPRTIRLREVTAYESGRDMRPVSVADHVFFPQLVNGRARIGELFVPQFTGQPTAIDTTLDTPSYIAGVPIWIAGSEQPGFVAVLASGARDTIYVHSFKWAADTKVQSSWSRWTAPAGSTIVAADCVAGRLALVVLRSDGVYLEVLDLGSLDAPGAFSPILVDRAITNATAGFVAEVDGTETKWTVPYTQASDLVAVKVSDGTIIPTTQLSSTQVKTTGNAGDLTATQVVIGCKYQMAYTLSRLFRRRLEGGDEVADTNGRLRLGYLKVFSQNSSGYVATVTLTGRTAYTYTQVSESPFLVPIMGRNDEATIVISHDGPLNCALTSLEWEGTLSARNRRV